MKSGWQYTNELLFGIKCYKHSITDELAIIGKYGEIWMYDNDTAYVLVRNSPKSRLLDVLSIVELSIPDDTKFTKEDEYIFKLPKSDIDKVLDILKMRYRNVSHLELI